MKTSRFWVGLVSAAFVVAAGKDYLNKMHEKDKAIETIRLSMATKKLPPEKITCVTTLMGRMGAYEFSGLKKDQNNFNVIFENVTETCNVRFVPK